MHSSSLFQELRAVLLLLAAVVVSALLVLLRRAVFRFVLRPISRALRAIFARLRALGRLGGPASKQKPVKSFLGLGVGAIAEAFTETDEAIAADFDKASVTIDSHSRLACTWIRPALPDVEKDDPNEDFERAKHLFSAVVPIDANPLNLYDDIHNAFIVNLLGGSDKGCFYILAEFRKVINANALALAVVFSFIVSLVAVANVTMSASVDFYHGLNLARVELVSGSLAFLGIGEDQFNKGMFGLVSCAVGYLLMWMFYQMAYDQAQRHNGREMDNLLVSYLAKINARFNSIHGRATQAVVGDADVAEMKRETVLWIAILHWMVFRVFFIEEFLRSILFQIRRNSIYALFLVPAFFIVLMIATAFIFGVQQLNIADFESNIYRQNSFYVAFPLLLYAYYRYLIGSLDPMSDSIEAKWATFQKLNVIAAMSQIMESYAGQLDQWRSRFRAGGPGGGGV
jgi:hypothetical protein